MLSRPVSIIVNKSLQSGYIDPEGDPMTTHDFMDEPPAGSALTSYDRAHMALYLRLIDSWRDGADWREAVRALFGLNPEDEPERCRHIHASHLARAQWMSEQGYRELAREALPR